MSLAAPSPSGAQAAECTALVSAAPDTVAGQHRRDLSPATRFAAAWGNPPMILRCGVAPPTALRPTSQCFVVDGVGWLVTQRGRQVDPTRPTHGTLDFTTIGRSPYVAVSVPNSYQPAADALVDLSRTVRAQTTLRQPCR